MSKHINVIRKQQREARLELVAKLYKRGCSYRQIRSEVLENMDEMKTYSLRTVKNDVDKLLKEWRENRLSDIDDAVQLELERIDDTVQELWDQWEKSKIDRSRKTKKRKGAPGKGDAGSSIKTFSIEETETDLISLGDVSYISEIRSQLIERRKLLGMYAPEKRDISGDLSFAALLMESGIIDDDSENEN